MPSLADLKRRITSVKNTQKITKAMKLVAASKFAKSQSAVVESRPYFLGLKSMVRQLFAETTEEINAELLYKPSQENKVLIIILMTDRGLCGGLNANIIKKVEAWVKEKSAENKQIEFATWGNKAVRFFGKRYGEKVIDKKQAVLEKPTYIGTKSALKPFLEGFIKKQYDAIYVAYPRFVSALTQVATVERVLPIVGSNLEDGLSPVVNNAGEVNAEKTEKKVVFSVEPSLNAIANSLIERKVVGQVLSALLEARVSEHGARMSAMDAATRNASEVIKKVTLKYNRARQASITKELIEIVSGAEAL